MCHNRDMAVMVVAGVPCLPVATMPRHEGDMPWARLVLLEGLTDSVGVGPSIAKVLDPVGMGAVWVVA